jgi:hypothetical protein
VEVYDRQRATEFKILFAYFMGAQILGATYPGRPDFVGCYLEFVVRQRNLLYLTLLTEAVLTILENL